LVQGNKKGPLVLPERRGKGCRHKKREKRIYRVGIVEEAPANWGRNRSKRREIRGNSETPKTWPRKKGLSFARGQIIVFEKKGGGTCKGNV